MMLKSRKDEIKKELRQLIADGYSVIYAEAYKRGKLDKSQISVFEKDMGDRLGKTHLVRDYQKWYTTALPVVRQILPDRFADLIGQYQTKTRKTVTYDTYYIADYLHGLVITRYSEPVFDTFSAFHARLENQIGIVDSALQRIESILGDLKALIQADVFNDELSSAEELMKKGHLRAAGTLAGVVLEAHFAGVLAKHNIILRKKNPTISEYNEEMKNAGIIDVPMWRLIQRLGDIRNYCSHKKERDPRLDEVADLLSSAGKIIAEIA